MDGHEPHCCVRLLRLPQQSSTAGAASRIEISSLVQESRNLRYQQDVLLPKGVVLHRAGPQLSCGLGRGVPWFVAKLQYSYGFPLLQLFLLSFCLSLSPHPNFHFTRFSVVLNYSISITVAKYQRLSVL